MQESGGSQFDASSLQNFRRVNRKRVNIFVVASSSQFPYLWATLDSSDKFCLHCGEGGRVRLPVLLVLVPVPSSPGSGGSVGPLYS